MKLSKIVKKITSISLAAALAVSGINYQPAKAEAAELPVVTVLGATLSLDADAGKQSMRVAIQVENADNASACGMSITYNGKKLDFSTEDAKYNKLYDYDEETKKVVYAVKIANIPSDNFDDNFVIEGFATPITGAEEGEKVTTEAPVEKSVDSVVADIAKKNPGVDMTKSGVLVKKIAEFDITSADSLGAVAGTGFALSNPYSNPGAYGCAAASYDEANECAVITEYGVTAIKDGETVTGYEPNANPGSNGEGIAYKPDSYPTGDYIFSINVLAEAGKTLRVNAYGTVYAETAAATGDWQTMDIRFTAVNEQWPRPYTISYNYNGGTVYKFKSFVVNKVLEKEDVSDTKIDKAVRCDLSKIIDIDNKGIIKYDDATGTIKTLDSSSQFYVAIPLPFEVNPGESVKVTISGPSWGSGTFRCWTVPQYEKHSGSYVHNNSLTFQTSATKGEAFTSSLTLTAKDKVCNHLTFKTTSGAVNGLVIDNISVQKVQ